MIRFCLACALAATPLAAQEMRFDPIRVESCLASDAPFESCIGASAGACMDENDGGTTTVGMGFCLEQEWQYWDGRLNTAYGGLMDAARATDDEIEELGATAPSQADALREMQRAWIPFRDRKCDYIRSQWGGGTGGGPAALDCLMTETAHQWRFLTDQIGER